jgi:hypothetical protein
MKTFEIEYAAAGHSCVRPKTTKIDAENAAIAAEKFRKQHPGACITLITTVR